MTMIGQFIIGVVIGFSLGGIAANYVRYMSLKNEKRE